MKRRLRLLTCATGAVLALGFAGSAMAAYNPTLWVQQTSYKLGASSQPGFLFSSAESNDATAKMTIFSPSGYTHAFTGFTPGQTVGQAYAIVKANALGGALLPLSGPVVVGNTADTTLRAASAQCRNGQTNNDQILVLNTSLQNQTIQIPDFVNVVGPYVTQEICLPPPATAAFQAQVVLADFAIRGMFANPNTAGTYRWVGDFTPYAGTAPNPVGTVEDRTVVGLPSAITFKRVKFKYLKFVGHISIHGYSVTGKRATLYYGRAKQPAPNYTRTSKAGVQGSTKAANTTPLKGNYFFVSRWKKKVPYYFQMRFGGLTSPFKLPCSGPSPSGLPLPCLGENVAPLTSTQVLVRPAKKKRHHR
jgi:hypothetical protein